MTTSQPRCQDSFRNLDPTVRLLRNRPNAIYNFTMGNRPKMSLKYAIFKICPKLARKWYSCETRVYSTIFGDSWRQKVVSVFGFGHPKSPFFFTRKRPFSVILGAKKGSSDARIKNGHYFLSLTIPKIGGWDTCLCEYHYWVSFGQFLKIAYFRLIFGRFPLIKSQNQNPMARSVKYEVWNLEFFFWTPNTQRQQVLRGRVTKNILHFKWHPSIYSQNQTNADNHGRIRGGSNLQDLGTPLLWASVGRSNRPANHCG